MSRNVHTTNPPPRAHEGEEKRVSSRPEIAGRAARLRSTRRAGFLGVPEIVALVAAAALLALAFVAYFFLLVPERSNLASLERERQQLQAQIRSAGENREEKRGVGETVDRIRQSLVHFETDELNQREGSEHELDRELNQIVQRSGVSRPQFSFIYQDDTQTGASQQSQQRAASNLAGSARRRQTVFPATDISLTIEGNYTNLRRFIRALETSPHFVVINSIQLEGMNDTSGNAARAALVSLRLDMSAYFRRGASSASSSEQSSATVAR